MPTRIVDFAQFKDELYKASCATLDAIQNVYGSEHLYSLALTTTSLFGYVFPNANTEEGLLEEAQSYLAATHDFNDQLDLAIKYVRWEPTTFWRFFGKYGDLFDKVNSMLDAIKMEDALSKLPEAEFEPTIRKLEECFLDVLVQLRAEGRFVNSPENFYVNICYQDDDLEELYRCALRVNSDEVCNRMRNELTEVLHFWQSKGQGRE